jgi:hypothetical protein
MKKILKESFITIVFVMLVVVAIAAIFSGCASDLKIEKRIEKINVNHPAAVATAARKLYPCITTHEKHDTAFIKGDSITNYVVVPCPDVLQPKNIHDTIHHVQYVKVPIKTATEKEVVYDTKYIEDSAKIFIANNISAKLQKQLDEVTVSRDGWRKFGWIAIAIFGAVILFFVAKISIPKLPI